MGVTVAYLNIGGLGTASPVTSDLVTNLAEVGAYYRRAWGNSRICCAALGLCVVQRKSKLRHDRLGGE